MKRIILLTLAVAGAAAAQPSALFPTSVATWNELLCASNSAVSYLSGSITNSATSITVQDGSGWASCSSGFVFRIDDEIIRCSSRSSNTFSSCTRGFNGTSAASHDTSTAVRSIIAAEHHNRLAAEVRAIVIALGAGFPATGFQASNGAGSLVARTLSCADSAFCSVANGNGQGGNPSISIGTDVARKSDSSGIPSGMVAFFTASCPSGWSEYTALRGRYAVGLVSGGALEGTVGTALTNQENRAVGQHTHNVTDPGHTHTYNYPQSTGESGSVYTNGNPAVQATSTTSGSSTTGITIANSGSVPGTNAPYIQLMACKKN